MSWTVSKSDDECIEMWSEIGGDENIICTFTLPIQSLRVSWKWQDHDIVTEMGREEDGRNSLEIDPRLQKQNKTNKQKTEKEKVGY